MLSCAILTGSVYLTSATSMVRLDTIEHVSTKSTGEIFFSLNNGEVEYLTVLDPHPTEQPAGISGIIQKAIAPCTHDLAKD